MTARLAYRKMIDDGLLHRDAADQRAHGQPVCDWQTVLGAAPAADIRDAEDMRCVPCYGTRLQEEEVRSIAAHRVLFYFGDRRSLWVNAHTPQVKTLAGDLVAACRALVADGVLVRVPCPSHPDVPSIYGPHGQIRLAGDT